MISQTSKCDMVLSTFKKLLVSSVEQERNRKRNDCKINKFIIDLFSPISTNLST